MKLFQALGDPFLVKKCGGSNNLVLFALNSFEIILNFFFDLYAIVEKKHSFLNTVQMQMLTHTIRCLIHNTYISCVRSSVQLASVMYSTKLLQKFLRTDLRVYSPFLFRRNRVLSFLEG